MFRNLLTSTAAIAALGLLGFCQVARAQDCCGSGCCDTGCTSIPNVKKVKVHCYTDECHDHCVAGCDFHQLCNGLFKGWHCVNYCGCNACETACDECGEGKCKKLHCQQKFLIVKVRTHEEIGHKCVPTCCPSTCGASVIEMAPPGPKPEVIPAPKGNVGDGAVQRPLPSGPLMNVAQ